MEIKKLSKNKFPDPLLEIPQPPENLWIIGELPEEELVYLSVVGSRKFTSYGKEVCEKLITGLKGYPVAIVSGFAMGIDTIAHKTAMKVGLTTLVFPGSGLSREAIFPKANANLMQEVLDAGGCSRKYHGCPKTVCDKRYLKEHLLKAANAIYEEDARSCASIGENGASLIKNGMQILTHCNAGALATAEMGTALAPMYVAHKQGKNFNVYVDETRPLLQGARLTAWELKESGISTMLVTDNCAGKLMADFRVDIVIVGADRIAANGDVANKIGTYSLAVLCNYHKIPFYVAAPLSTFDLKCKSGRDIKIELRGSEEVTHLIVKTDSQDSRI
jgi:translation initiation factor 2B subunit (eIF-2B alpha/beta/delta family)